MITIHCNLIPESIPEGSDWDGEQRRKTTFNSEEEKAAYDAPGLIELARKTYGRQTVTVADVLDLRRRGHEVSGDDDKEVTWLRRAIALELTRKPAWEAFVNGLEAPEATREKLRAMLTPEAYKLSIAAYRETCGTREAPSLDAIMAEIMTWPVDRLIQECEIREKPTLLIVSEASFDERIEAMDANKHYQNETGGQKDVSINRGSKSPYIGVPKPTKAHVSITDGIPNPAQRADASEKMGEYRDHLATKYEEVGMRHIYGSEMQTLFQRSLIEALQLNDASLIVNNWKTGSGTTMETTTILNPDGLRESDLIACSYFSLFNREAYFRAISSDLAGDELCGRATTEVMEF